MPLCFEGKTPYDCRKGICGFGDKKGTIVKIRWSLQGENPLLQSTVRGLGSLAPKVHDGTEITKEKSSSGYNGVVLEGHMWVLARGGGGWMLKRFP